MIGKISRPSQTRRFLQIGWRGREQARIDIDTARRRRGILQDAKTDEHGDGITHQVPASVIEGKVHSERRVLRRAQDGGSPRGSPPWPGVRGAKRRAVPLLTHGVTGRLKNGKRGFNAGEIIFACAGQFECPGRSYQELHAEIAFEGRKDT
jgi:hypothetical protein